MNSVRLALFAFIGLALGLRPEAAERNVGATNAIRVALMTFTADDNSYRSSLAAANLADGLQALLSNEAGFTWIDRLDLQVADHELELSELGLVDSAGALRRGRRATADWLVTGSFSAATNESWQLLLEVVDSRRAELLAVHRCELSRALHPTLRSTLPQLDKIATEVRKALHAAHRRWLECLGKPTMALLMLLDGEEFEADLARAIEIGTDDQPSRWRVLRPIRLESARGENEMVLLGLAQQDATAWEHLAEGYAWGYFSIRHAPPEKRRNHSGLPYLPELLLTCWRGGEPTHFKVDGEVVATVEAAWNQRAKLKDAMARDISLYLKSAQPGLRPNDLRTRVAGSLVELARTWRDNPERPGSNASFVSVPFGPQLRILEAACFFDPANPVTSELLLRTRWNRRTLPPSLQWFWHSFHQSKAWGQHRQSFGLAEAGLPWAVRGMETMPSKAIYLRSAFHLVDRARLGNASNSGFPADMSGNVARKWLAGFTSELARRAIETSDEPETKALAYAILVDGLTGNPKQLLFVEPQLRRRCIEALWPAFVARLPAGTLRRDYEELGESVTQSFAEAGLPGAESSLLDQLYKAGRPPAQPVVLPRAADVDRELRRHNGGPPKP